MMPKNYELQITNYEFKGRSNYNAQKGQVGIIAILVGVVIFTLGMSVAARVTTDVRLAARSEEGARANAAAEAAMEIAMSQTVQQLATTPTGTWTDGLLVDSSYTATALPVRTIPYVYELGPMSEGEVRTVWLVHLADEADLDPFDADPYPESFQIGWTGSDTRVEVALFYHAESSAQEVSVWRNFLTGNNFFDIDPTVDTKRPSDFNDTNGIDQFYLVRIKMVHGDAGNVVILPDEGGPDFPIQEFSIVADGETEDGQVRRRTTGKRKVGEIPLFFDYVLASGNGDLVKL